jgi:hypothetical protein
LSDRQDGRHALSMQKLGCGGMGRWDSVGTLAQHPGSLNLAPSCTKPNWDGRSPSG